EALAGVETTRSLVRVDNAEPMSSDPTANIFIPASGHELVSSTANEVTVSTEHASDAAAHEEGTGAGPSCANCGADVAARFCCPCGQKHEHALHSIWHVTREVTEDLTHAGSRLWSTMLALLFKPGFLTREFIAGRRVRYLPPLRLYLVLSVLFFLVL